MNCRQFRKQLGEGKDHEEGEAAEHVAECAACRELVSGEVPLSDILGDVSHQAETAPPSFDSLKAEIDDEPNWRSGLLELSRGVRFGLLAVVALVVCLLVWLFSRRPYWEAYPALRMWAILGGFSAMSLAAIFASMRPLYRPSFSDRTAWLMAVALVAVGVVVAGLPPAEMTQPEALAGMGAELVPRALQCLAYGTVAGMPVVVVARLLDRARLPRLSSSLMVGAGAGIVGNAALQIHCPIVHQEHLLLGHATVTLAAVGINLALYRWRRSSD